MDTSPFAITKDVCKFREIVHVVMPPPFFSYGTTFIVLCLFLWFSFLELSTLFSVGMFLPPVFHSSLLQL